MRMTQAYGANGSKYDEKGRCMEPKPIWSKYENFTDPQNSAARHFDETLFRHLCAEYFRDHGVKPTKAFTTMPKTLLKSQGFTIEGVGFVMLDIITGQPRDYVSA